MGLVAGRGGHWPCHRSGDIGRPPGGVAQAPFRHFPRLRRTTLLRPDGEPGRVHLKKLDKRFG